MITVKEQNIIEGMDCELYMKRKISDEPIFIHPFEVYELNQLATKLNRVPNTIRNMFKDGLEFKKVGSITYISGQNFINYINKTTLTYTPEQIEKVLKKTGVNLHQVGNKRMTREIKPNDIDISELDGEELLEKASDKIVDKIILAIKKL